MNEQDVKSTGTRFPTQRISLPLSEAARASLVAVRAAQEAARERARRQTMRTRAWLGGIVGGIAFGFVVFGSRPARHDAARAAAAHPAAVPEKTAAAASAAPASVPAQQATAAAGRGAAQATVPETPGTGAAGAETPVASADSVCTEAFGQRRWRLSIDACAQAFEAHPGDGSIALRLAHAYHGRARLPEAGDWAKRAIALNPTLAEAFVIVAHAESHAGHTGAALDAYREYLNLAPRGWHASEARAAVRAHNKEQHAQFKSAGPEQQASAVTLATDR